MVGNQIGDFRIIEKLGEGGMGVVYKAVDVRLDRPVAIKMLTADLAHNPELEQRFQAEARAQANLNHTNLATLYAFLVEQGNAYMVMEFVEGENFDQIIRRSGPMNPRDAIPWFKQALLGIGAAHRVGIIHRDIKPSNLMLNRQGIVKVMDFGIAKAVGTRGMTRTGVHLGTLAYMSPEQIQGRTVDVRSDIYALGITLYEMLSGHVPFESESEFQTMHDHVSTLPPPLTRLYPYAPREFEGVVAKALSKNPDDRFQTVEEFGVALEHPENVAVAAPPVYAQPPAMVRGTVVESVTGPGQWQGAGVAAPVPVVRGPATVAGTGPWQGTRIDSVSPAALSGPAPTVVGPAPAGTIGGAAQPRKLSPLAGKMIAGGVAIAVAIVLAIALWPDKSPAPGPSGGGGAGGGQARQNLGGSVSTPSSSGPEIVVSEGGSIPETPPPNNPQPHAAAPGRQGVQTARNQPPPSQPRSQAGQPTPRQQTPAYQPQQQPAQASSQSFMVKHRHVVMNGMQTQVYFCAGPLLVQSDGTVTYACAGTTDPSRRCEHVVFPPGSIRQVKLLGSGELHLGTSSMGNWDFYDYNVAGSTSSAYSAILPFAR
jgi:tRNA A-37 threonylcarbamoyl transferase component Bud32